MMDKNSKYLIYTSFGDKSQIGSWLSGWEKSQRPFDIWATYYGDTEVDTKIVKKLNFFNKKRLGKLPNFFRLYEKYSRLLSSYESIWIVDDDIQIENENIEKLFHYRKKYGVSILQPSNSNKGKVNHLITKKVDKNKFRYTNFVELTAPFWETNFLIQWYEKEFLPLKKKWIGFEQTFLKENTDSVSNQLSEENFHDFGLDYWWSFYARKNNKKMGIVDEFSMINPFDESGILHEKMNNLLGYDEPTREKIWYRFNEEHCVKCDCEPFQHKCNFYYFDFE